MPRPSPARAVWALLAFVLVVLIALAGLTTWLDSDSADDAAEPASEQSSAESGDSSEEPTREQRPSSSPSQEPTQEPSQSPSQEPSQQPSEQPEGEGQGGDSGKPGALPELPKNLAGDGTRIFGDNRFLVAYYGTPGTGSLGVLGENPPEAMHRRLTEAAQGFDNGRRNVVPVYEIIVTVADGAPGKDGDYSHDIDHSTVQQYLDAADRHGALVVLDIQTGRSDFLKVAKRWKWALKHPNVGLALDPEWRMGKREVPGQVIGSVDADEVNRTSHWLSELRRIHDLPEKVFMLHQFRTSMLERPQRIEPRDGLAMVQHIDGYGTPGQKLATYNTVALPDRFTMGFKLFYDEDRPRMRPAEVTRIQPRVRFVSFQ